MCLPVSSCFILFLPVSSCFILFLPVSSCFLLFLPISSCFFSCFFLFPHVSSCLLMSPPVSSGFLLILPVSSYFFLFPPISSRQKNYPDKRIVHIFNAISFMSLIFSVHSALDLLFCVIFLYIFSDSLTKAWFLFYLYILQLFRNSIGPNNHNLYHKTLMQVTKHCTQNVIS